ncbi:restriction endonuclease subunit S [Empedobacter tilapiae]|uniref:restriction endonuclease subunit S n=1 Tax=Empedobacter tilapiae TaxID=2491114 RepID=UPI0028D63C3D|nr:restriction endonuclease subunit S [Empedobacter tilapiae]
MRFPGFEGKWETKKLGEVSSVSSGGTPSRANPLYWNGDIPWISTTLIDFNFIEKSEEYITQEGLENSSAKLFPIGTLLMAMYGQGKTRGKVAILNIEATTNQACGAITTNKEVLNPFFAFQNLVKRYDEIRDLSNQGSQENLSGGIIKGIEITFPKLPEQIKITSFLSLIDERIQTQNKMIEQLETLIKGLYQKIFELNRFQFSILPLKSLCTIKKGEQINASKLSETGIYYVMNGGILPSGYHSEYNSDAEIISISEGGNSCGYVQYNHTKFWSGGHCYTLNNIDKIIKNKYLYYYLKANENKIKALRVGSGLPNIQKSTLEKFEVKLPNLYEQEKVVLALGSLSTKITVESKLLENYKIQKKHLLQNLFI